MNTNLKLQTTTNKENIKTYLKRLLSEKEIPLDTSIEVENIYNFTYDHLIEIIGNTTEEEEIKIRNMIIKIDLINADIKFYFKHLLKAFFKTNYRILLNKSWTF